MIIYDIYDYVNTKKYISYQYILLFVINNMYENKTFRINETSTDEQSENNTHYNHCFEFRHCVGTCDCNQGGEECVWTSITLIGEPI